MVHGVPGTLAAPDLASDAFEPTPWERWSYDESDNGGRTPATAGASNQTHWNTPSSVILDALQRPVVSVDRSGMAATDSLRSESRYDITGNLISVSDPLGRTAFAYAHDLLGRRWREQTLDGGFAGSYSMPSDSIEVRDQKERCGLPRWTPGSPRSSPGRGMRRAPSGGRERIVYGDDPASGHDAAGAAAANLSAGPGLHYDEAGLATVGACDFRQRSSGAPRDRRQRARGRLRSRTGEGMERRSRGELGRAGRLEATVYETETTYDALNRVVTVLQPQPVTGASLRAPPTTAAARCRRSSSTTPFSLSASSTTRADSAFSSPSATR